MAPPARFIGDFVIEKRNITADRAFRGKLCLIAS
jgi:hypothetical protein